MRFKTNELVIIAIFISFIIVLGYIFIFIPNVEMVTTSTFLAGYLLGSKKGLLIGTIAEFLFSLLNPLGVAAPPLLVAQVISMGIIGYAGGIFYFTISKSSGQLLKLIQFGFAGLILTVLFDLLTTLSFAVFMAETSQKIFASVLSSLVYGIPFYLTHVAVNLLIFILVLPLMIKAVSRIDYFKARLIVCLFFIGCLHILVPDSLNAAVPPYQTTQDTVQEVKSSTPQTSLPLSSSDSNRVTLPDSTFIDSTKITADSSKIGISQDSVKVTKHIIILEEDSTKWKKEWQSPWSIEKPGIRHSIYKDLAQVLTYLPGFYTIDLSYPGQVAHTMYQGFPANNLVLLYEGRPLKDPHTNLANLNLIPVEAIQKLSVEQGFYADVYPQSVAIETENLSENVPYSRVYFHKGPSAFSDVDVTYGQRVNPKVDAMLGFTLKGFSGPVSPESYEHHIGRLKYNYKYSPKWHFNYSLLYNRLKLHPVGPEISKNSYATPNARSVELRFDHTITIKGNVLNSYYQNLLVNFYYTGLSKELKDKTNAIRIDNLYRYVGMIANLNQEYGNHHLTAETTFEYDWTDADDISKRYMTFFSLRLKDDFMWNDRYGLRGKIDLTHQSAQGMHLNSGLGAFYKVSPSLKSTIFLDQYYRYASLYELFAENQFANDTSNVLLKQLPVSSSSGDRYVINFNGNANLQPESIRQLNWGLDFQPFHTLRLMSTFYLRTVNNGIDYQVLNDSLTTMKNRQRKEWYGFDFNFQWDVWKKVQMGSNFAIVDSRDDFLAEAPSTMFYGYIQYMNSFFENDLNITLRFEGRYWGERWSNYSNSYIFLPNYYKLPGNWIINFDTFVVIQGPLKAFLSVENILDEKYQLVYGYPMNGRTIHYGLRWEFRE